MDWILVDLGKSTERYICRMGCHIAIVYREGSRWRWNVYLDAHNQMLDLDEGKATTLEVAQDKAYENLISR